MIFPVGLDSLWLDLVGGDFWGFLAHIYTSVVGSYFYAFVAAYCIVPIYMRSQNVGYIVVYWALYGLMLASTMPAAGVQLMNVIYYIGGGALITLLILRVRD